MGPVIVEDEVEGQTMRKSAVQLAQEGQELLMPRPAVALADDGAVQHTQGGEQRRRPVPRVVMRERPAAAFLHREPWLGAVQRLNLTLLVYAQHHGFFGRIHVQPDDVRQLFSTNAGSVDSLNVVARCGWSPCASQTRCTVA